VAIIDSLKVTGAEGALYPGFYEYRSKFPGCPGGVGAYGYNKKCMMHKSKITPVTLSLFSLELSFLHHCVDSLL